jgi:WD40 repeat protein
MLDLADGRTLMELDHAVERAVFAGTRGWIVALEPPRRGDAKSGSRLLQIDPADGRIRASVTTQDHRNALAVSPDRKLVAVAGDDQTIVVRDADTLAEKHRFRAHDAAITALRFHPDKPLLASAAIDHSVKIWDYAAAKVLKTFIGLDGRPIMLSFSPNGRLLAVDGMDKSFRIYDVGDSVR